MKNILWVLTIILVVAGFVFPCMVFGGDSNALAKRLAYLKDLPEISWVKFDDNNVYIGFNTRPSDLRMIVNAAAIHGNRALGFGVHVWAVRDFQMDFHPRWDSSYCTATARHGKLQKSDCR